MRKRDQRLINPRVNYSVIAGSELAARVVINHILQVNSEAGVEPHESLFGDFITVSDTDNPSEGRYVISRIKRPGFAMLNVEVSWSKIYREIFGVKKVKDFRWFLPTHDQLIKMMLLKSAGFISDEVEFYKGNFRPKVKYEDKAFAAINFMSSPNRTSFQRLVALFGGESEFPLLVSIMTGFLSGDTSRDLLEKHDLLEQSKSVLFRANVINESIRLLRSESYHEFMLEAMVRHGK